MAKSSRSETRRSLRVGVIQNGKVIEEILVRDPRPIYIGTDPSNDLVVGPQGTPDRFLLFEPSGQDAYTLHVGADMVAEVEVDDQKQTIAPSQDRALPLAQKTRGKVTIGQTVVVFEYVDAPPLVLLPPLPAAMKAGAGYIVSVMFGITVVLFSAFLLSGLLHGTLVALGYFIPPPPRNDGELVLNARLTRIMSIEEIEEDDSLSDLELDDDSDLVVEQADDDSEGATGQEDAEDTSSSSKGSGAAGGDAEGAITGTDRVIQGSAFGALMDGEGGFNLGIGAADSASERSAAEALMNQATSGAGGGGAVAKNLGSVGSGSGDGSGRIGIGGDGDSAVKSAATAEGAATDQKQVTVKANVGDKGSRVAGGSGSLTESHVQGVLGRFRRRVERCYQRTLSSNPSAGGRVELQFRIDSNGQTTDARLPTNELGDTFGNCITSEVRRLRFDKPSGGGPVTVSQRYVLQPSN